MYLEGTLINLKELHTTEWQVDLDKEVIANGYYEEQAS